MYMKQQHKQIVRTFFHSVIAAALGALALTMSGHGRWGAGFLLGAAVSLFSLFSLKACVPALFYSGAPRRSTALLQMFLVLKLPVYAGALYIATKMGSAAAFAAFVGCTLVPGVITLETLVRSGLESSRAWKSAMTMQAPIVVLPAVEELSRQVSEIKAEAREAHSPAAATRTVTEGAV